MKRITFTACTAALLFFSCSNEKTADENSSKKEESSTTETAKPEETAKPMDTTGMAKAWMDFATPGDMHKWMAKFDGTWEADVTGYMDPAKPEKSKATNVVKTSLNGLYQEGKYAGTMMGMPFEGHSTMGYDNARKMFVNTWIDNMGSGIVYMTGTWDDASKTLNLKGKQTDPMTGKDADIREVMKVIDDNNYTLEMYGTGMDGKETKFMDAAFKRKK